jgi:hypothetical protein
MATSIFIEGSHAMNHYNVAYEMTGLSPAVERQSLS